MSGKLSSLLSIQPLLILKDATVMTLKQATNTTTSSVCMRGAIMQYNTRDFVFFKSYYSAPADDTISLGYKYFISDGVAFSSTQAVNSRCYQSTLCL
jgi:hypothetical protein